MGNISMDDPTRGRLGSGEVNFYKEAVEASQQFREEYSSRLRVMKSKDMPFENSPDGRIKHVMNDRLNTAECCMEAYMQFIQPDKKSGKHRHLSEEVCVVLEGSGYDLHWDVTFDCLDKFYWEWEKEPKRYDWKVGDFVYIPPFVIHQHFAAPGAEVRLLCITNRIVKAMGFDWHDQLETADGYEG